VRRCLPVLLTAVALGGCGSAAAPPPPTPVLPRQAHIRVVTKTTFVHRVNRICDDMDAIDIGTPPSISTDVVANRRSFGAWYGRLHKVIRRYRQRFVELGQPTRDRARWERVITKIRAAESHLDTMRAAAWSGSVDMFVLSAHQLVHTGKSLDRRLRRFGAKRCA
jgi:hypothetical protein